MGKKKHVIPLKKSQAKRIAGGILAIRALTPRAVVRKIALR